MKPLDSRCGTCTEVAAVVNQVLVAQKVTTGVYKGVTTSELDELAAETAASMTATHPDYATVILFSSVFRGSAIRQRQFQRCCHTPSVEVQCGGNSYIPQGTP
jgi:hypothetical protein